MQFLSLCITSAGSFVTLFLIAKFIGHKQISQLDFFDYITGISIGSTAAELATELEEPWKPLTSMVIYGIITWGLSIVTNKSLRARRLLYGKPVVLMDHGRLYRDSLRKAKLDLSEFLALCRQQGYFDLNTIQTAIFECTGKLTILPVTAERPATPADLGISPRQELIYTEIIMDGRIMEENLKHMGLDRTWLDRQLKQKKINSPKEVLLALCDRDGNVLFFENR